VVDDDALARAAAAGDAKAFTRLVEKYEKSVRNLLDRLCGGAGGDDLAQEAFIRAWRSAASYRGDGTYRAWLFRIAWRVFLTSRSGRAKSEEYDPQIHGGSFVPAPGLAMDLQRALARLAPRERAAAILCFGEGCSHQEAAIALEMPLGTLKSIVARARNELVAYLEAEEDD
jgi:RNA polymerase sigma-70 factor (ECF subfamily)